MKNKSIQPVKKIQSSIVRNVEKEIMESSNPHSKFAFRFEEVKHLFEEITHTPFPKSIQKQLMDAVQTPT